uniref:PBP domain-containing protein n=1 Tax=Haptolina brevifila TaxID=156173 RepID=A0A7S2DNJ2_9EUKA
MAPFVDGESSIINMHGAGTTNPQRLFWESMDLLSERAKLPLHMTYRAVGSSTGQKEFMGDDASGYRAYNHFGAGDIPMTFERYNTTKSNGRKMVHVPFAMGAIGVFHSVPTAELGGLPIDLTGCLLARIFSRDITHWEHPDIRALNPKLTAVGEIKVYHRVEGSSSTAGFTQYLEEKCPESWTLGSGSTIVWPSDTYDAQGSGGMSDKIDESPYAIGYIDAGHGHERGFGEIALLNRNNVYLTTLQATISDAAVPALAAGVIPSDPTADFSNVNLYDQTGAATWPITMISYLRSLISPHACH